MGGASISHWGIQYYSGENGPDTPLPFHALPHDQQLDQIAAELSDTLEGREFRHPMRAAARAVLSLIGMPTMLAELEALRRENAKICEEILVAADREGRLNARYRGLTSAASALSEAEAEYRRLYGLHGDDAIETGRAWDAMRRTGNSLRLTLNTHKDAQ